MLGLLWLAASAVPPRSPGAVIFLALFAVTLPWSVVGFWNAAIGFLIMSGARDPVAAVNPLAARIRGDEPVTASTAILMCIRNESPDQVIRNLRAAGRRPGGGAGRPSLSPLCLERHQRSRDHRRTKRPALARSPPTRGDAIPVTYRRRAINSGFKAGNIRDFCDRWGADHEFAVTLDADSFMRRRSGAAPGARHAGEPDARHPSDAGHRAAVGERFRPPVPVRHAARHALLHARAAPGGRAIAVPTGGTTRSCASRRSSRIAVCRSSRGAGRSAAMCSATIRSRRC